MSEDYYIGLSRKQIENLLGGEEVGKRPYVYTKSTNKGNIRYNDTIRVHVKMLSREDELKEPCTAFDW